ncbi:MAG: adenylate/guanylate cyclase domain-containing protein, partial [Gammaproteobacteria bacterium]
REKIDNVGCFFSSQIADQIKSEDDSAMLTVNRRRITVFYSKIVNYNMLKNSIEAEDYVNIINDYIESMAKIIHHFGGAIDFFESGNLMVVFGDKQTKNVINDAMDCVNMARAMQEKILELNEKWKNDGLAIAIELAMAISSGFCSIGFFGNIEHRKYSVVGNNISAVKEMLEKASDNQILISYETFLLVKESFSCSQVGDLNLSWMKHPIIIYSVEGDYS